MIRELRACVRCPQIVADNWTPSPVTEREAILRADESGISVATASIDRMRSSVVPKELLSPVSKVAFPSLIFTPIAKKCVDALGEHLLYRQLSHRKEDCVLSPNGSRIIQVLKDA